MAFDYKQAGVDIEAGDALVDWLRATSNPKAPKMNHVVSGIGGFAALFELPALSREMKKPCLVSATDGVGTKLRLAIDHQRIAGLGQDLVAMCANDLICCGAEPLFFLDYYATGRLDLPSAKAFLQGVREACEVSGMALIGGETAEMPGMYPPEDFDCAGFAVGLVDAEEALGASRVRIGDRVLGVASSGCHSNGYSLLRRVFADDLHLWVDELLTPTALYAPLARVLRAEHSLKAMAHITGGGIDNVVRVFPDQTAFRLKRWPWPRVFSEVQQRTGMADAEMMRTLNCGVGLALVVSSEAAQTLTGVVEAQGFPCYDIGEVVAHNGAAEVLLPGSER